MAGQVERSTDDINASAAAEVKRLRAQVADLKAKLAEIHMSSEVDARVPGRHPWFQIAVTVGITFALGKIVQAFRLPTATAVAIPMITTELNRRYF